MNAQSDNAKAGLGVAILLSGSLVFFGFFFGVIPRLLSSNTSTVRAIFAGVQQLAPGMDVRVDGAPVGTVSTTTAIDGGREALVEMHVKPSAAEQLHANASAQLQWLTLLGANYAIAIDPGTPGAGRLGSQTIPLQRTSTQVELDQVTGALVPDARRGMQELFHELPQALADPRQPGGMLSSLADSAPAIAAGFQALRGERPDQDLRDLERYTGQAMRTIAAPDGGLRSLVANAALTLQASAGRAGDLTSAIDEAASVLPSVRSTLASLDHTLTIANPLLDRLTPPAGELSPTLRVLHPVVDRADRLLSDQVRPLAASLRPTAQALAETARVGSPLLDQLEPSLRSIGARILPDLATRAPDTQHTTYEMIGPTLAGLDGIASHYDSQSYYIRFTGSGGGRIFDSLPCRPYFTDPGSPSYLQCESLAQVLQLMFSGGSTP